jgi:nitrogen fixation NifU-like protein
MGYSETYIEHFQTPHNVGAMEAPDVSVEVEHEGGGCYDRLRLMLRLREGRVEQARFQARACSGTIAAASAATEWSAGRELADLAGASGEMLEEYLGGIPEAKRHSVDLAALALRRAAGEAEDA